LFGHKWFTSAITADVAFTLATTEIKPKDERSPLTLFYLPIRNEDGSLNHIEVEALKDKLGTKALPTAQLQLKGVDAIMVGEEGKGVKTIATLFNITRIYNSVSALSYMRRAYSLCQDYSEKRISFGKKLSQHSLYKNNLKMLQLEYESNFLLVFELAKLLGNEESGKSTEEDNSLLRLLTPVSKLYSAKKAIACASEHIEMFGGLGYLEDTRIPTMLRDAQVLSIWEGTTNVLSLDMLRAITKENGLDAWSKFVLKNLTSDNQKLKQQKEFIKNSLNELISLAMSIANEGKLEDISRELAFQVAEISIASLWIKYINKTKNYKAHNKKLDYIINNRIDPLKLNLAFAL
jgi:alkylation response protein AidB-like acyl-CoA dehydrogenase